MYKPGDICKHCKRGKLEIVKGGFPSYDAIKHCPTDYLMCSNCDSTYPLTRDNNERF